MRIYRAIMLVVICFLVGCGGGSIGTPDEVGSDGGDVTTLRSVETPLLTVLRTTEFDAAGNPIKCLMNYPDPAITRIKASVMVEGGMELVTMFGLLNRMDANGQEIFNALSGLVQEVVGFFPDDGKWGILLRTNDMAALESYLQTTNTNTSTKAEDGDGDDQTPFQFVPLDDYTMVSSRFQEPIDRIYARAKDDGGSAIDPECVLYGISYGLSEDTVRPVFYASALGTTALLDSALANVPDISEDVRNALAFISMHKDEDLLGFSIGLVNTAPLSPANSTDDAPTEEIIMSFSTVIDTGNIFASTLLDFMVNREWNFGGEECNCTDAAEDMSQKCLDECCDCGGKYAGNCTDFCGKPYCECGGVYGDECDVECGGPYCDCGGAYEEECDDTCGGPYCNCGEPYGEECYPTCGTPSK